MMKLYVLIPWLTQIAGIYANTCPHPPDPEHGQVTCPSVTDHFSICALECDPGYVISGSSRQMCWCRGRECTWKGAGAICEHAKCDMPLYDNGRVLLADKWPRGFGGVVEFDKIPTDAEIHYGWSIVIVFDRPLGKNASISSWNTEMSAASYDGQTFTLANVAHNEDLSSQLHQDPDFKVLFVVNYVDGDMPSAAYAGIYGSRIRDASCVIAPKMPPILTVGSTASVATKSPAVNPTRAKPRTTRKPTTTRTTRTRKPFRQRKRYKRPPPPTTRKTTTMATTRRTTPWPTTTVSTTTTALPEKGRYCIFQRGPEAYVSEKAWTDRGEHKFTASVKLHSATSIEEWSMVIVFSSPIKHIQVWSCRILDTSADGKIWTFGPLQWDAGLSAGDMEINMIVQTREVISGSASGQVYLCSDTFTSGDALMMRPQSGGKQTEIDDEKTPRPRLKRQAPKGPAKTPKGGKGKGGGAAKGKGASGARCGKAAKNGIPKTGAQQTPLNFAPNKDGTKYNYNELLHKSILFFEAQRSGKLPPNQRVPWRGDSGLKDGCSSKVDASGGWYDAGNFVKYNFPMAFSLTTLAWGGIAFKDAYEDAGELQNMIDAVTWPTKYFIKCHTSKFEMIGQVGDAEIDNGNWGRPEEMPLKRPTYKITASKPGTELAAEAAAALAASSIFLKTADPKLSASALKHAKELYEFADKYRGMYHVAIPAAASSYKSYSGYEDELVWSAAWLYKATNDNKYLKAAGTFYEKMKGQYVIEDRFAWDAKLVGAQALLAEMTGNEKYRNPLASFLDNLETAPTTPKGMYFLDEWAPNRYTSGAAFIVLIAGTLVPHLPREQAYMKWAEVQMGKILGDTGRSYVIGFGKNYPKKSQHRASSCPPFPQKCDWSTFNGAKGNHYILYGALVGGTDEDGVFNDYRANIKGNHVACDYNAVFQSAIAGLKHFAMKRRGQKPLPAVTQQPEATTRDYTTPASSVATVKPSVSTAPPKPSVLTARPKTKPTVSEKVRCARTSPTGRPVRNAKQTPLNFKPNNDGTKHNYNQVLHLSLLFFEAQMAGKLPTWHRVPWRGDSTLKDGCDVGTDVSGGWFDAGDHVKFGFPMAFSLTTLTWGGIAFRGAYEDSGEMQHMINTVKWGAEFFINAHTAKNELIGQVGNGKSDHDSWGRPEMMSMRRPTHKITSKKPGTELAAEAAAGLAASSIFLKQSHPTLAAEALRHAKELYEFADKYRGLYHESIKDAKEFYQSFSGFDDELIWGAAWLYKATNDKKYLKLASGNYYRIGGQYVVETRYSWDRKLCGAQAILGQLTGKSDYTGPFFKMIDGLLKAKATPQGMHFLTKWGSNRYAAGAAFMASIAASMNAPRKVAYQKWAQKQIDLMLGDAGKSFVVGYGKNYPKRPHHRSSSCPPYPQRCDWSNFNSPKPNYYILYGALVGGPDAKGNYLDKRSLYEQTEVTTDYNACFQSAVAGVKQSVMKPRRTIKTTPKAPVTKATTKPPTLTTARTKPKTSKPTPSKPKTSKPTASKPKTSKPKMGKPATPKPSQKKQVVPSKKPTIKPTRKMPIKKLTTTPKGKGGKPKPTNKPGGVKPKKTKTATPKPKRAGPTKRPGAPKGKVPCKPPKSSKCKEQARKARLALQRKRNQG